MILVTCFSSFRARLKQRKAVVEFIKKLDILILAQLGRPTTSQSDFDVLLLRRAAVVDILRSLTIRWLMFGKVRLLPDLTTTLN